MSHRSLPFRRFVFASAVVTSALALTCARNDGARPGVVGDATSSVARVLSPTPAFASTSTGTGTVTVADIAERTVPSVVNISATRVLASSPHARSPFYADPFFRDFFGPRHDGVPAERRQRSLGSGVIVSADGVVLTNNHVVEHAEDVEVALADGRTFAAKLVGSDPKSDLAVLRLEGKVENLQPLGFGDSSAMRLGDVVIAIGNPFGVGQTVTMGIVSATGRGNMGIVDYEDFIQTDAAINPGNSGGALVNMRGELVGINTAILSRTGGYQGIGFAIPSSLAKPIMESLVRDGKVTRGWLGVSIQDLDDALAAGLGLKVDRGVLVSDVSEGSPADKAGFQRGDVIVEMNGAPMVSTTRLRNQIAMAGPRAKVTFRVLRKGASITLEATLGDMPGAIAGGGSLEPDDGVLAGATVRELDDDARRRYRIPAAVKRGVVVTEVDDDARAYRAGLRPGDVILEVNRRRVDDLAAFQKAYQKDARAVLLLVQRGPAVVYLAIRR